MRDIKLSSKIEKEFSKKGNSKAVSRSSLIGWVKDGLSRPTKNNGDLPKWNFVYPIILLCIVFISLALTLINLQVVQGEQLRKRSENNQYEIVYTAPFRGVIMDRNGKKLAENIPSVNVTLSLRDYRDAFGIVDIESIEEVLVNLETLVGKEKTSSTDSKGNSISLSQRIVETIENMSGTDLYYTHSLQVLSGISNDDSVLIKSRYEELPGIQVDDGSARNYVEAEIFAHILGYTGDVFAEDLENLDYIGPTDSIGRTGVERLYDKRLFGVRGRVAREVDSSGDPVSGNEVELNPVKSGESLYLTLDLEAQKKMYEILKGGVDKYDATGGAGILQDVNTGEIITLASYPSFNSNDFVGGISQKDFEKLLNDPRSPLTNKAIAAEVPPGSTFKTIVAAAGLDSGQINRNTQYLSKPNYTFSDGSRFQEYRDRSYGWLNVVQALTVSSNLYFCEMIRGWDIDELVKYFEEFGIGEYTYIDVPGEGSGRLPSPANKIRLAKSGFYWLEDVWYPEGDSCNTVIGQGITTTTPIQMSNWIASIANGGTLLRPHVAKSFIDSEGNRDELEFEPLNKDFIKDSALQVVREGMWSTVNGERRVVVPLSNARVVVAAKTGTAEFGRVNAKGVYEHTHAWVTGFFPYENPKYSFVIFLEDGGESNNAAVLAADFINWWVEYSKD